MNNDYRNDKNNLIFNKVNNNIILLSIFLQFPFNTTNEPSVQKTVLGKKRNLENILQSSFSKKIKPETNNFSFHNTNEKKSSLSTSKMPQELLQLYNMERSICMSCVKTKNKKYQNNKFIPCIPIPFSHSS